MTCPRCGGLLVSEEIGAGIYGAMTPLTSLGYRCVNCGYRGSRDAGQPYLLHKHRSGRLAGTGSFKRSEALSEGRTHFAHEE